MEEGRFRNDPRNELITIVFHPWVKIGTLLARYKMKDRTIRKQPINHMYKNIYLTWCSGCFIPSAVPPGRPGRSGSGRPGNIWRPWWRTRACVPFKRACASCQEMPWGAEVREKAIKAAVPECFDSGADSRGGHRENRPRRGSRLQGKEKDTAAPSLAVSHVPVPQ